MPIVLVVDDSEVDRRLVGGLLSRDIDWLVEYASNGREALDLMQSTQPDVVVTDLMMPDMDGMELVSNIRLAHPNIPVILITGHGSETLAVDALDQGAASYVPKSQLSDKLLETVEQVMALERADRSYGKLIGCMVDAHYSFELANDPQLIPPLVDLLQQMLMGMQYCDTSTRMHVGVALEESLLNAMLHGNLELSHLQVQETRDQLRQGTSFAHVEARRKTEPFSDRMTYVRAEIAPDTATFVIRDQGNGFDTSMVPERGDPSTIERDDGRGLVLMRNFMDEVKFNDAGNEVTLVLRHPT